MAVIQSKACPYEGHDPGKPARISVAVTEKELQNYNNGTMLIQEAFPYMTAADRERFLTGYCEECWNKLFPPDEED